jgi:hypothetical protein
LYRCGHGAQEILDAVLPQLAAKDAEIKGDNQMLSLQKLQIAELAAVVAKLPKTRDGVPITEGMVAWFPKSPGVIDEVIVMTTYAMNAIGTSCPVQNCYSTCKDAEQAEKEKTNERR